MVTWNIIKARFGNDDDALWRNGSASEEKRATSKLPYSSSFLQLRIEVHEAGLSISIELLSYPVQSEVDNDESVSSSVTFLALS